MKNFWIFSLSAAMVLTACSNESEPSTVSPEPTKVTLTFSPYQMEVMARQTRSTVSIADVVTHLDVWIYESGTECASVHQASSDAGFGNVTVTLDKTKTYTLYAIGHRADGASLTDGVISFTDDKVTHSMYYSTTFSPATTTNISAEMTRIVGQFRLEITDDISVDVAKMQFTVTNVFDRWDVSTGGTHGIDRTSTIMYNGSSSIFNVYAIVTDTQTKHTVTVTALDADGQELQSRTFTDVTLCNGYRTTYRGTFFIDTPMTMTFTVGDWNEFDIVNF